MGHVDDLAVSADDVVAAAGRLLGVARRTPVYRSSSIDAIAGAEVFLKVEAFQRTGSFKFRGAYNAVASMSASERSNGVVAFSSGNHAQAVALAAQLHHVPAVILMPSDAPPAKLAATMAYGAEVVFYDRYAEDREQRGAELQAERGLPLIRPFDDPRVIAGQGTAALELFDEVDGIDVVVAPVGGGGLLSGTALAAQRAGVSAVVGVEPAAGDDVRQSLAVGERVTIPVPRTIADGQQTTAPGELTLPIISRLADGVVTVTDDEIVAAMVLLFERCKLVAEPSGASAIAAVIAGHVPHTEGKRVGVIISGGNVSAERFAALAGTPD